MVLHRARPHELADTEARPGQREAIVPESLGVFLLIAVARAKLQVRTGKNWVYWTMADVVVVLAGCTTSRNQVYRSEIALREDTASKSPYKPRAFKNLGYAFTLAGRNEDAAKAYRQALHLNPDYKPPASISNRYGRILTLMKNLFTL